MELDELKSKWSELDLRLDGADAKIELLAAQVVTGKVSSAKQRLRRRHRMVLVILAMLPFYFFNTMGVDLGAWAHVMLAVFIAVMAAGQIVLLTLLGRIDPATQSLTEACVAVIRYRKYYLAGTVVGVLLGVTLLTFIGRAAAQDASPYMFYGFLAGLLVGVPLGVRIFMRVMGEITALRDALRGQEA